MFPHTIPGLIEYFSSAFGDAEAIVRDDRRATFRQLDEDSAAIAKALLAQGVGKGSRIGILAAPGPEFIASVLAAGRIGAVAGPLSTLLQAPELQWVIANAEFDHLITDASFLNHDYLSRLEQALPGLAQCGQEPLFLEAAPRLRRIHVIGDQTRDWAHPYKSLLAGNPQISAAMLRQIESLVTPADPFCIIHTSGSTANPKGVIHGHGPFVRHSWQMGQDYNPFGLGDRIITPRALFWVAGFVATLFYGLCKGSCLVSTNDASAANVLRLIQSESANALAGDSGWFDMLRESDELKSAMIDLVRLNMDTAGLALHGHFISDRLVATIGTPQHWPNERFARTFGMTETLGGHTAGRMDELLPEERPCWQGKPVPGMEIRIVDPKTRVPLPSGEVGEVLVRGYAMMLGLNGKEQHETFDAEGFYATGDLCRLDAEGFLKFESRSGEMIKIHGANVSPSEVELVLTGLMGIEKVGIVGVELGGEMVLAAAVVMVGGRSFDGEAVKAELKQRLSSYKVPRHFVVLDSAAFPATGSGKVKRSELQALLVSHLTAGQT